MKLEKKGKSFLIAAISMWAVFVVYTILVTRIDVKPIGPMGSKVGFATLNGVIANIVGFNSIWYKITEILGYLALLCVPAFAVLGAIELIKEKSFKKVDTDLYVLCGIYALTGVIYILFEKVVINYRPIILDVNEGLEASYPSSHSLLGLVVLITAAKQIKKRVSECNLRTALSIAFIVLGCGLVIGRAMSGVHWISDICGAVIAGTAILLTYDFLIALLVKEK